MVNIKLIKEAHKNLSGLVEKTPVIRSYALSNLRNNNTYLKLESLQETGSFKLRGSTNKLLNLSKKDRERGVVAISTGNHGKGVAYAANKLGIKATIFMSKLVPKDRLEAIKKLGATVKIIGNTSDEAEVEAKNYVNKTQKIMVHPFDDPHVIAGQGTIGIEMLEQFPDLDTVVVPTSGGGLIGGIAIAIKYYKPKTKVIAVSMKNGASMYQSLKKGCPIDVIERKTLADSLGGSIGLNNKYTFNILQNYIDDFVIINEKQIASGIKYNFQEHKLVTEGAAATGIVLIRDKLSKYLGKNIICLVCGGNINSQTFIKIIK
tara:strand:- start:546 stop:1502 length:957 start_codon:yes stop_codon:yes gene_type:complete